ncbi:HNH endonuclease [Aquamicrobium soli]|uniref:HNH endonuclease n=1 Tax=Aquamicrobium soli TaxID=1811518 RepID=A0ABV7KCQ6_9HYPH
MARGGKGVSLKTIGPRLGGIASRFASQAHTGPERDQQRAATAPWREWYKTSRWQALRRQVLQRDLYTCQRTGVLLIGKHPAPNSPVVDHIKPHRGDPDLFWDEANLMAVSKAYHDSEKQKAEQGEIKGVWY